MGVPVSIPGAIRRGRAAAEKLMLDRVTITRITGEVDDLTGEGGRSTVYAGRAKIQTYEPYESDRESAGSTVIIQRYSVHVPVNVGPFEVGDLVHVDSSVNPLLDGSTFRVAGPHEKTLQTAQRLLVDELTNLRRVGESVDKPRD